MEKGALDQLFEALSAASCCPERRAGSFELRTANSERDCFSRLWVNLIWLRWRAFMEQIYNNFQISMKTGTENC